ncbi:MAG: D-alanyl-D-alanine carboxypeptidase/D-alanyl-D-alanine-endopeptidase [Bacteroidota bacterium]
MTALQRTFTYLLALLPLFLAGQSRLQQAVRAFALDEALAGALISVDVIDVASGQRLAYHQPGLACIPASTQKLITTAYALERLGPSHRFATQLIATGKVVGGVLEGDLYIVGGGDPSLGSPYQDEVPGLNTILDRWVAAVRNAGISRINGRVVGDGSYFGTDAAAPGWPWSDLGNYYGSGAYGLNLHENFYFLDFLRRSREGTTPPVQRTRPEVPGLQLTNELRSGPRGSGDQAYIYGAPFSYDNYIRGTIPVGTGRFTIKGALPDPPRFAAQALQQRLEAAGITTVRPAESDRALGSGSYAPGQVLDVYQSPELIHLIDRTNLRSNNLYAEALLRAANKAYGLPGYALSDAEAVTEWLGTKGLPLTGVHLEDGSGLATRNFFPAALMTAFLRQQADQERWRKSIPLAGQTGSMRGFLKGTAAEGRLYAKSGSVGGARNYAGYVVRADGKELAFAIMVNNYTLPGKELRNKMLNLMRQFCEESI